MRNTVKNQDVRPLNPEEALQAFSKYRYMLNDLGMIVDKRTDRREMINRPRKGIRFELGNNMIREFRKEEVVSRDDEPIKSALRNKPATPGRLVKLDVIEQQNEEDIAKVDEDMKENCGSESDRLETQSGDCAIEDDNDTPMKLGEQTLNE